MINVLKKMTLVLIGALLMVSCSDDEEQIPPVADESSNIPVTFVAEIINHKDLSTRIHDEYNENVYDFCLQLVKQGQKEFVQLKEYNTCSEYSMNNGKVWHEFEIYSPYAKAYKIRTAKGVDVGIIHENKGKEGKDVKNLVELCTGEFKDNCDVLVREIVNDDQRKEKVFNGLKITEPVDPRG